MPVGFLGSLGLVVVTAPELVVMVCASRVGAGTVGMSAAGALGLIAKEELALPGRLANLTRRCMLAGARGLGTGARGWGDGCGCGWGESVCCVSPFALLPLFLCPLLPPCLSAPPPGCSGGQSLLGAECLVIFVGYSLGGLAHCVDLGAPFEEEIIDEELRESFFVHQVVSMGFDVLADFNNELPRHPARHPARHPVLEMSLWGIVHREVVRKLVGQLPELAGGTGAKM